MPTRGYRFIAPVRERRRDNSAPPAGPRPGRTLVVAQSGVFVVPASGGALEALAKTRPDEGIPSWPELLPGGRHLLFSVWRVDPLPPVGTA